MREEPENPAVKSAHQRELDRTERERRTINRLNAESDVIGTSATARMASSIKNRFGAADVDQNDPVEVWGTRIGRGLGLIAAIGLAIYLFITYVLN